MRQRPADSSTAFISPSRPQPMADSRPGGERFITLSTPGEGGIYHVLSVEEDDKTVIVRVGGADHDARRGHLGQ
jgi:hypothetical protein